MFPVTPPREPVMATDTFLRLFGDAFFTTSSLPTPLRPDPLPMLITPGRGGRKCVLFSLCVETERPVKGVAPFKSLCVVQKWDYTRYNSWPLNNKCIVKIPLHGLLWSFVFLMVWNIPRYGLPRAPTWLRDVPQWQNRTRFPFFKCLRL